MLRSNYRSKQTFNVSKLRLLYIELLQEIEPESKATTNAYDTVKNGPSASGIFMKKNKATPISAEAIGNAWLILSSTGEGGGQRGGIAAAERDDITVAALMAARSLETRLVEILRSIGELVVFGEQNLDTSNGTAIFDYFCEKRMIALLVDIVRAKPASTRSGNVLSRKEETVLNLKPVVYTPAVKAQVLQTISLLVSNVKDQTSLYYLLSNDHINLLISSLLPLRQFTAASQEEIIPVFMSLLKSLAIHLVQSPALFQFFIRKQTNQQQSTRGREAAKQSSFPLFSAAVEVAVSPFAKSDRFVRLAALSIFINICGLPEESIRATIEGCVSEQQLLFTDLCEGLVERYQSMASCVTGSNIDHSGRHPILVTEVMNLLDQLHFLNDIFECGVRSLNVRLCEWILRDVVFDPMMQRIAVKKLVQLSGDKFSEEQAMAHVAVYFLSQMFLTIEYTPFCRMCAVAILHPFSPASLHFGGKVERSKDYALTHALNNIVQGHVYNLEATEMKEKDGTKLPVTSNPCRIELLRLLKGCGGDARLITAVMLMQSIVDCNAISDALISKLAVLSNFGDQEEASTRATQSAVAKSDAISPSEFEDSLYSFLSKTTFSYLAVKCVGSFAITLTRRTLRKAIVENKTDYITPWWDASILLSGIRCALTQVAEKTTFFRNSAGLSTLFVDIMQAEVRRRYGFDTNKNVDQSLLLSFRCATEQSVKQSVDYLVRERGDLSSEIEDARSAVRLFLLLRSLNSIFMDAEENWKNKSEVISIDAVDVLVKGRDAGINGNIARIGGKEVGPAIGTEVDLKGRTYFPFVNSWRELDQLRMSLNPTVRRHMGDARHLRGEAHENGHFVLVLDPLLIFVARRLSDGDSSRGVIICGCSLRNVIATATEKDWLHIIVRQGEDVGIPIHSGSMAFRFFNVGTCLVARRHLEKCRETLYEQLLQCSDTLLKESSSNPPKVSA